MRAAIEVCAVRPEDRDGVIRLCLQARGETWTASQVCSGDAGTVARHLGALTASPGAVGRGATFSFWLPPAGPPSGDGGSRRAAAR